MRRVQKRIPISLTEMVRIYFQKIALLDILQSKYVGSDVFLDLMKLNYGHIDVIKNLTSHNFKKAVSYFQSNSTFDQDNITKLIIKEVKNMKNSLGVYQRMHVFYVCTPGNGPKKTNIPWYADSKNLIIQTPRSWTTRLNRHLVTQEQPHSSDNYMVINDEPPAKRQCNETEIDANNNEEATLSTNLQTTLPTTLPTTQATETTAIDSLLV